ncbi:(R)-mandelonitrile lyase [Vibrio mangrovi]|uniref:Cupin domain protein n=1 Tax=Vibrio mangrovi TaxID=474394 RepID=A0A1Y6ITW4_9VIBR|nr:cupin domain-containing protein [Vibrio mangrovi]MDW6004787.1 cupin domain-containing protein [Vibrio mangrovi]SMS01078.1 Cupin domain protein [Vibrio mangrovi]
MINSTLKSSMLKTIAVAALCSAFSANLFAAEQTTVIRKGENASFEGPAEYFTGKVKVDMLFPVAEDVNASGAYVTFEPGARSAWHTHPAGQKMVITSGVGLTQEWGGEIHKLYPGDVLICPPGVKHWHGASIDSPMTHLVITGDLNGKNVEWMEKVTDEQYQGH